MALPGMSLVRLRALCNVGKYLNTGAKTAVGFRGEMRWFVTKPGGFPYFQPQQGKQDLNLLEEFPHPKDLLVRSISRGMGSSDTSNAIRFDCSKDDGMKKATVTVLWPHKFEEEGYSTKKSEAESLAAAAACLKLKQLGLIGPDNQLPPRNYHRSGKPVVFESQQELTEMTEVNVENDLKTAEALSLFPNGKDVLYRVLTLAKKNVGFKSLVDFRTTNHQRMKRSQLTLQWPEKMTFTASAKQKMVAERGAAALACMKLKELGLIDKWNQPLTEAEYRREEVEEVTKRGRSPLPIDISENLQHEIREYLTQFPLEEEVEKQMQDQEMKLQMAPYDSDADKERLMDAITGRSYRPLSQEQVQDLNLVLREQWGRAGRAPMLPLPVDAHRERVISAVQASRVVVIAGDTGCGKTTRIPRFFLEECITSGQGAECNILVTQPRRISAVTVANRVANELGPGLSGSIGYQVRMESRPPENSGGALLFLTVGVLLRKLQRNPFLKGISHVFVDEVHERDINTDLLLAVLQTALKENPDLRVVLMSATGNNERLSKYFGDCPIVKVPGFMYPVQDRYLEEILSEMGTRPRPRPEETQRNGRWGQQEVISTDVDLVADVIEHVDKNGEPGAILCFLPGWQDIKAVHETLASKPHFSDGPQTIWPLHSNLSVGDQQKIFQRPQEGHRKIVLATNIAETSITIDDIVHVVDAGTHKEQKYDPGTKVSCLDTVWVSQSNITQRRGRAGRCQPGHSYHLFPRQQLQSMSQFPVPEILRMPLENLVVQAKIHSPDDKAQDFLSRVLDCPSPPAVTEAVYNLQNIGVLDRSENLTPLGQRVAAISCDPVLAKVMVLGTLFRCVLPVLSVAACLTREPFYNSLQNRPLVDKAKRAVSQSSASDYLVFSRVVLGWRELQYRDEREEFLSGFCLSRQSLRFINGLISQFSENLSEAQLVSKGRECQNESSRCNQYSDQDELLKGVLLAGLYPNLIKVKKGLVTKYGRFRPNATVLRTKSGPVHMHRATINRDQRNLPTPLLTFYNAVKSNNVVFVRDSSTVNPLALLLLTDCDTLESVSGDHVNVSLKGNPLVRFKLSPETWDLLRETRNSIQIMLYRNLDSPSNVTTHSYQDRRLISLLVKLLNENNAVARATQQGDADTDSDSEVD